MSLRAIAGVLVFGFASHCMGAEIPDIGPEIPYPLTKADAGQLVGPGKVWFKGGNVYNCEGFGVSITKITKDRVLMEIRSSEKMNLGSSIANLAGDQGGRFLMEIQAVLDENGNDIYDRKGEHSWSNSVRPTKFENGNYIFTRSINLSPKSDLANVKLIKFKAMLSLPVGWHDFTFNVGPVKSSVHPLLSKVEATNDGIHITHPRSLPDIVFVVYGLNASGQKLLVSSQGYAGKIPDNHWFYFNSKNKNATKIRVLMSNDRAEEEVSFSIVPPAVEPTP